MTFKGRQLNSMTFQAWKMKFLNSMTFQVFHDLYENDARKRLLTIYKTFQEKNSQEENGTQSFGLLQWKI